MAGILMLADPEWFAYHKRSSLGGLAIFYASPHKFTKQGRFDHLFCVRPGKKPRSIVGVGRIQAQPIFDQNLAWERYGTSLGASTEAEWQKQASAVLANSRKTYGGKMLAIELVDFQSYSTPILPDAVGLDDRGWSDKKEVDENATVQLLDLLKDMPTRDLFDSAEVVDLERQLNELWSGGRPSTPAGLRQVQRVVKVYERPDSIKRYVKRTRGTTCQLCGELGFVKRTGVRYCEIHHLFHLSKNPPPNCLTPEFLVVLCATCHRRMHYANVGEPERVTNGWRVRVDDAEHHFETDLSPSQVSISSLRISAQGGKVGV